MRTPLGGAAVALALGLLLGLERERAKQGQALFAGIRTFPLFALCGFFGALAAGHGAPLALPAVILAVAGYGLAATLRSEEPEPGVTTEMTAVLAALLGAAVAWGEVVAASSAAVVVALLLTLKAPLHRLAGRVSEDEILAIVKFALVAVVIVPLLPAAAVGPYGAIVPREVGLLVVILSGVGLLGYLLVRLLGGRAGWALAGALGGLASSTATTLSFAGKARAAPEQTPALAIGVVLASTILYLRGIVVLGFVDRELALYLAPRLGALFVVGLAAAFLQYRGKKRPAAEQTALGNPVELGRAVVMAAIFAAVVLLARAAQEQMGRAGLWAVGAIGGLVDVDSVALAAARIHKDGRASLEVASGAYLLATVSNLAFKTGAVLIAGGGEMARRVLPAFATLAVLTGVFLLVAR
jgi:uncharacterized membrane protein (DUF4010 family)